MCKRRVCAIDKRTEKGKGKREEKGYNTTGTGIGSIGQAGRQAGRQQRPPKRTHYGAHTAYCQKVRECRKKSKNKLRHLQKEERKKK